MSSYRELFNYGKALLKRSGVAETEPDAWLLMEYVFDIDRTWYFLHQEEEAGEEKAEQYARLLEKRAQHIPLQQLTCQAWFYGLKFYVNEHVLIPRQDTEILVEEVLKEAGGRKGLKVLDLCTGSGCILLSLLEHLEQAQGMGADLSEQALLVAEKNAQIQGKTKQTRFVRSDLFEAVCGQFDILVSNPPYIPTAVIRELMDEVRLYEPRMALDGHEDGLYFYREIAAHAGEYLKGNGILAFEIGYDQGEAVSGLLEKEGYREIRIVKDLAGLDRVVIGRKQQEEKYV
ncbi:MAG TPA: peptide chain release factor N(5)-glutamine methyltransferase [Candidatus Blautia merdavium]|uniref:Release factor glutamine methyltransferase n=1 Tax=Candidatus Blautia merdavium TaxID=2838494 RepID=A0A9D2PML8_9FIRM|nr:peptide chain release factor N(5)-glutamine methyltransferase [Candidatus Blautia merdavium]